MAVFKRNSASVDLHSSVKDGQEEIFTIQAYSNLAYQPDEIEPCSSTAGTADSDATRSSKRKSSSGSPPTLKKSLNLLHCIAVMIAVTGSNSIFVSVGVIVRSAGSIGATLIVWLAGGLINMGMALCYAEMGAMFPYAGGYYTYVLNVLGSLPAFLIMYGQITFIVGPSWALLAYTSALYIVNAIFPGCVSEDVELGIKLLACWILVTVVVVNCTFIKFVTKVQTFLTSTKMLALLIIIGGGTAVIAQGKADNFENIFANTSREPGELAVTIIYTSFAYGGWQVMMTMAEEIKNPGRNLPRSIYIGFTIVIMKYILANVAYFTMISPAEMLQSDAVALMFSQRLYVPISIVISVLVATSSTATLNAAVMGHSRLVFAGSRAGHMPLIFGMIHPKYLTPRPATFLLLSCGMIVLFIGDLTTMMAYIGFFSTISGIVVIMLLLYLRVKKPSVDRPYKTMLCVPIVQLIVNLAVLVMASYQRPHQLGLALAILAAGIPLYWFGVLWKNKPREFTNIVETMTVLAQKAFVVVTARNEEHSAGKGAKE
ncbi:large neutral amino acids transporter small subunit 1-like [Haliotis asinina]|uniref:large neutral amino acids transporter small subunit 1-like n=1 Tax=Haliotis asinina TaxID=109174 RepID=UPI0035322F2E